MTKNMKKLMIVLTLVMTFVLSMATTGFAEVKSNDVYKSIVENQNNLICTFEPDTTLTFVNEAYASYFNKKPEELIGVKFLTLVPAEAHEGIMAYYKTFNKENSTQTYEHKVNKPNGEVVWQRWIDQANFNEKGEIIGYQAICIDITSIKEKELATDFEAYKKIIERQDNLVCTYKGDTTLTFVNEAYASYFQRTPEELKGVKFDTLVPEESKAGIYESIKTLTKENPSRVYTHKVNSPEGVVWQTWIDQVNFDENGEIIDYQGICIKIKPVQ